MNGPDIVKSIEEKLKDLNIKKGQFYKDCGVSSASFSQWRLGHHLPEYSTLARINEYLGTSFTFSENKETPTPSGERKDDPMLAARTSILLQEFEKLSDEDQNYFLAQIIMKARTPADPADQK